MCKNKHLFLFLNIGFKYQTDEQIKECINILSLPLKQRISQIIEWIDTYGYHISTLVEIYFDYCLKQKDYDKISKLAQIENQLNGEYSTELQTYALMSIFDN